MNDSIPKTQHARIFAYTVTGTFEDRAVADEWIKWLRTEHVADVLAAGALDAEIVRLDGEQPTSPLQCEVRYHFSSRVAFGIYQRDHAPKLRALGLQRFPASRGITYQRATGEVCDYLSAT